MDLLLDSKCALITGAGGDIGQGIARAFVREGATVILHGRDSAQLEQLADTLRAEGGKVHMVAGDLASDQSARKVADEACNLAGHVDILINNAAIYTHGTWLDDTPGEMLDLYNVNVVGAARLIQQLVPPMRERHWGRIIQIASGDATEPLAFMSSYAATKAALVNLTVGLARSLANTGITVNTISPGIIATEGVKQFYRGLAARFGWANDWEAIEQHILTEVLSNSTGRLGTVEEVADLVAFVASPLTGYIDAANIRIDGGSTHSIN
ncbi:MAG TPA: SDR family oxidoreductase [Aggregatilineaceae bacterium]|nr:SDR family oxidoreductase [Aggregatilineaceae bacterium]